MTDTQVSRLRLAKAEVAFPSAQQSSRRPRKGSGWAITLAVLVPLVVIVVVVATAFRPRRSVTPARPAPPVSRSDESDIKAIASRSGRVATPPERRDTQDAVRGKQGVGGVRVETVLHEDFSSNERGWVQGDDKLKYLSVGQGKYTFEQRLSGKSYNSWLPTELPVVSDSAAYELSCVTAWVSGVDSHGYGLAWGDLQGGNFFAFSISANGYYQYAQYVDHQYSAVIQWTKSAYVNRQSGANRITVRKTSDHYEFYINGNYVSQAQLVSLKRSQVGLRVDDRQRVEFLELSVSRLAER